LGRIKLDLPEKFTFSTQITLRVDDINYGGHASNDAILSLIHEARLQFLESFGYSELDIGGVALIMADAVIIYKSEGFRADVIKIEAAAGDFSRFGFDIYYKLHNFTTGKDLAYAKTGMVCFDYKERKVKTVPEAFRLKLVSS